MIKARSFSSENLQKIYLSTKNQLEEQLSKAREDHEILLSSMMEEVNKLRDGVWSTTKQKLDRITSSLEEMRELIAHQSDNSAVSGPLEESGEGEVSAQLILNEPLCGGTEAS